MFISVKAQLRATLFWCSLLKKIFILKDNLIDWICSVSMVRVRIIADTSIAHDWQGIRYSIKKKVVLRIRW